MAKVRNIQIGKAFIRTELKGDTLKAKQAVERGTKKALTEYGKNAVKIIKRIITEKDIIDTHTLHNSMAYEVDMGTQTCKVGTNTHYAQYQELGTYKMAARPFMQPGLDEANKGIAQIIKQTVGDELSSTQKLL